MRISTRALLLSFGLACASAAPSFAADKETRQMMADIRILQEQSQQLQNTIAALTTTLTDAVKALNARIDDQTNASRKSLADQKLIIDTISNDIRILREKVDDNSVRVGTLGQEIDALNKSVAAINVPRAFGAEGGTDTVAGPVTPDGGANTAAATGPGASPQQIWNGAMNDYYSGAYDLAVLGFEAYVKSFPQSPQAADAQLHIGNSYYQAGKYDKAVDAYDLTIRTYPKSSVLPEAYVKKGSSLKNLKQYDPAREALEYVIKNYPNDVSATVAQQRLQEIKELTTPAKR